MSLTEKEEAKIDFTLNYILAPNDTGNYLEKIFFNEYYNKNICFKKGINDNKQYFIYCLNSNEFDPKKFKNIYFKSTDLNLYFILTHKDLFISKNNYIYFLILFQNNLFWSFGELFLKKYCLVFDNDKRSLGFYTNIEKVEENNDVPDKGDDSDYAKYIYISLLVLILIGVIAILIVVILKKAKRRNRANELDDNADYEAKIYDNYNSREKSDKATYKNDEDQ